MALSNVINSAFQLLDEEAQWTPTGPQAQQVSTLDQTHHHANPGGQSRQHDDLSHTHRKNQPSLNHPTQVWITQTHNITKLTNGPTQVVYDHVTLPNNRPSVNNAKLR